MNSFVPRTRSGRIALTVAVVFLGILLSWWLLRPAPSPALLTSPVVRSDVEETVEATGTIKPSRLVSVGAQVSGRIEELRVQLGDTVKTGDLIAEIDSRTQLNTLKSAQAALENARANRQAQVANLRQYELAFERQKMMLAAEATSQADYDSARASLDSTRAQIAALDATIAQQQTEVATAKNNLGYTRITAPIDGTVLKIVSKQGQTVNAALNTPTIVMLGDLSTMTIYAEISEADVVKTKVGQDVWFTVLGNPEKRYNSILRDIAPAPESIANEESNSSSGTSSSSDSAIYYNGLFDIDNPDGELRTYMTAQVSIVLGRVTNALTIPSSALGQRMQNGRYVVQVLDKGGRRQQRWILIGLDNNSKAEVKSGLKEGERVIVGEINTTQNAPPAQRQAAPGLPPPM